MAKPIVVPVKDGYDLVYEGRVYPFTYKETADKVAQRIEDDPDFNIKNFASLSERAPEYGTEAETTETTQA